KRHKIVLYNPKAVFWTMPLALVALGSYLDPERFEVRIIDGRLEADPIAAVLAELDGALCLGLTVLTGAPIRDALLVTAAAKASRPGLLVVWGGWHASLFPVETLAESGADAVVVGQGEETFAELLERRLAGADFAGVAGCAYRDPRAVPLLGEAGAGIVQNPPRAMKDINAFPAQNYDLIDVESYFKLKSQRQFDYISSQGCRFRCTFCADPFVYRRGWVGLAPERMGEELAMLWRRYRFTDIGFQDETFFTKADRVAAIAEEFIKRDLHFSWMATMRADQGTRLDAQILADCKRAGLRRVMIGVESGAQEMLDRIKKDITLEQVYESAEKCLRQGINVLFNMIVGFPGETAEHLAESLRIAKKLRAISPTFEIAMFYYKPYPGNPIADDLLRQGYAFPQTLAEWADFDYVGSSGPWMTAEQHTTIERFKFYQRIAWSQPSLLRAPLRALARWRCERDIYAFPIEKNVVEWLRPPVRLS
ncbi:MAG TPA: radical SAM protein, partial [Herpetosiphonaceae bacterium]